MTIHTIPPDALEGAIHGARGAAAGLAGDAHHVAHTLQARAQRAALGALAVNAAAARLEAYAHVLASRVEHVRLALETEAAHDAATYRQALLDGETDSPEAWAVAAFTAWLDDAGADPIAPLDASAACAIYTAAFIRTVRS